MRKFLKKKLFIIGGVGLILILLITAISFFALPKSKKSKYYKEMIITLKSAKEKTEKIKKDKQRIKIAKLQKTISLKNKEIKRYKNEIERLRLRLQEKQKEQAQKEIDFAEEKKLFRKKEIGFKNREKELRKTIKLLEEKLAEVLSKETDEKISRLVKMYENVPPDAAAEIINNFEDTELLVKILSQMKEVSVSRILSALDAKKAADITNMIAKK